MPARRQTPTLLRDPVYIVDFAVYKPDDELKINLNDCAESAWKWKHPDGEYVSPDTHDFVRKVFEKSGIDKNGSYLPKNLHPQHTTDPRGGLDESFAEARLVMGGAVEEVLRKTGIAAQEIDILVVTSSVFCPTPSVASMIINLFRLRDDVQAYSLGGMGCGNGVIAIQLVRDILQAHPGANALFLTAEICSAAFYQGRDKHCLVSNALFRMGSSAAILTSGKSQRHRCKYQLTHAERIHTGARDTGFNCMYFGPDAEGQKGIFLYKELPVEAGIALERCLKKITPQIMTWGQYAEAAAAIYKRKWYGKDKVAPYVPDYTRCVDHFCLHAGGYAILKGIQKGMKLPADKMMASFANLKDYGNTSSSTTWYSWAYLESVGDIKKGQRLMQAGVGGGMKAGVNVWQALKDINDRHPAWAHVPDGGYTEADLPRCITRKEEPGTVNSTNESVKQQDSAKESVDPAADIFSASKTPARDAADGDVWTVKSPDQNGVVPAKVAANGFKVAAISRLAVERLPELTHDGESLVMPSPTCQAPSLLGMNSS